jgi:ADP-heptose:LPS heptosyltransferase
LRVVLTGSSGEAALTRAVADAMTAPALDLAGETDLGALGVLLRGARLLVCNDTGVSHVAAGLRVPSVVVFDRMSDREGWPPLDRVRHRVGGR